MTLPDDQQLATTSPSVRFQAPHVLTESDHLRLKLRTIAKRRLTVDGIVNDELPTIPGINCLALATRYMEGGRARFIQYVQLAVLNKITPVMNWWMVYRDLTPAERQKVSYDDICAAAQVRPSEFLGAVVACAIEHGQDVANLAAAAVHPAVVHQAGKSAKRIGGTNARIALEDRRMLFEHHRFVPVAQGGSVNVNVRASANAQAAAAAAADPSVPSFAADMEALGTSRQTVQKAIEGEVVASAIDGGAESEE